MAAGRVGGGGGRGVCVVSSDRMSDVWNSCGLLKNRRVGRSKPSDLCWHQGIKWHKEKGTNKGSMLVHRNPLWVNINTMLPSNCHISCCHCYSDPCKTHYWCVIKLPLTFLYCKSYGKCDLCWKRLPIYKTSVFMHNLRPDKSSTGIETLYISINLWFRLNQILCHHEVAKQPAETPGSHCTWPGNSSTLNFM